MNHLGDTNKMVDTPRTDEAQFGTGRVSVSFARQLERELNAANDRIKRLEEAYSATEAVRTIRDCWCNHDPDTWTRCSTCCDKIKRYHAAKANLNRTEEAKEAKL
jgi:hypothetical protein